MAKAVINDVFSTNKNNLIAAKMSNIVSGAQRSNSSTNITKCSIFDSSSIFLNSSWNTFMSLRLDVD